MKLNFVQNERELKAAFEVCEAGEGNSLPREVWIIPPTYNTGDKPIWCAVDNVDGHAWTEDFVSLDGALMWALGVGEIDDREEYDLPGHATFRHRFAGKRRN